ncbi:MAG TPA: DUF2167 domain-containing protein [Rhodanobacteraceae bacterium]|nr:DUF2167 domain-containing protein [Rhodanobacteraceae bacterium]
MKSIVRLLAVLALIAGFDAAAQDNAVPKEALQLIDSLHYRSGKINVDAAHAALNLNAEFRFLDAADAQKVLSELWGNPPDDKVLGMLVPVAAPLSDPKKSWAVVITYKDEGYVSDKDAAGIDYDAMLKEMQEGTAEANAERKRLGYPEVQLVGWATKPHYDASTNKLYWAKELAFDGGREHALNYDIRVLGRGGYLSLNAVAGMNQLHQIEGEMQKVLALTEFDAGQRYSDFNSSTDKVAAYGIAALVAGAIAAKAGLFAKLFVLLLAFKKVAIAGFIALAALVRKFFARSSR